MVTSFKYWHFLQYDITREVDQVCGAQLEQKLHELKGTGQITGFDRKICPFGREPRQAFEATTIRYDIYEKN